MVAVGGDVGDPAPRRATAGRTHFCLADHFHVLALDGYTGSVSLITPGVTLRSYAPNRRKLRFTRYRRDGVSTEERPHTLRTHDLPARKDHLRASRPKLSARAHTAAAIGGLIPPEPPGGRARALPGDSCSLVSTESPASRPNPGT